MRHWLALLTAVWLISTSMASEEVTLTPAASPSASDLPRYGINLGGQSAWGAEQLLANILANPGFEATLERSMVIVGQVGPQGFSEDESWLKRADGFWQGARGEILSGALAGRSFSIRDYRANSTGKSAEYFTDTPLTGLQPGDALSVLAPAAAGRPARWWSEGAVELQPGGRPGSPGQHYARLDARNGLPARLNSYIDTLPRAGRLLPVSGPWRLSFWIRSSDAQAAKVRVRFAREGESRFIDQEINASAQWQRIDIAFAGNESSSGRGSLGFSLSLDRGAIDVDDIYLGERDPGPGGFRQAVVATLRTLRPGQLRDWQGQLGDTPENRFAADEARRPVRYRPGEGEIFQTYSAQQVITLAAAIDATPWLVLPSTLSQSEARRFGEMLRSAVDHEKVAKIIVEFGNENWNPLFRPGGIPQPRTHAFVAKRSFAALRAGFIGNGRGPQLISLLNARQGDWPALDSLREQAPPDSRLTIAPYFSFRLDKQQTLAQALSEAFVRPDNTEFRRLAEWTRRHQQPLAAYELNFHTTEGDALSAMRNALVSGASSGPALASRLLAGSLSGLQEQAIYALAGYDAYTAKGDTTRLFGITENLATPNRLRPSGQALQLLNQAAGGNLHALNCQGSACPNILAGLFSKPAGRSYVLINGNPQAVSMRLPNACEKTAPRLQLLDGSDPWRETPDIRSSSPVQCRGKDGAVVIPGYSLGVVGD